MLLNSHQRSEWASPPSPSCLCDRHRACPSASEESRRRSDDGEETCTGSTNMAAGRVNCDDAHGSTQCYWRFSADSGSSDSLCMYLQLTLNKKERKNERGRMGMPNACNPRRLTWSASCEENESDSACARAPGRGPETASAPCRAAAARAPARPSESVASLQEVKGKR